MKTILLDTHLLLWTALCPERLSNDARNILSNEQIALVFSVASIWEVVIKRGLGRTDFTVDARLLRRGLLDNRYRELMITSEHAVTIDTLPQIHRDPFDRILVAQAIVEGITLLTADPVVARYQGPVHLV